MSAHYIIFEGPDGAGKSTAIKRLSQLFPQAVVTRHPGATPLGSVIRRLTKTPEFYGPDIKLDTFAEQLLMVVDNHAFTETILKPSMADGKVVFADRCNFISGLAYGIAGGLKISCLEQMFQLVQPVRASRLYLFDIDDETADKRKAARGGEPDRFDDQTKEFISKMRAVYGTLLHHPDLRRILEMVADPDGIFHIDGRWEEEKIVSIIEDDLRSVLA